MLRSHTVASKLSSIISAVLVMAVFLTLGGSKAQAGDRDDAKALVGYWQAIQGKDLELKGDGTVVSSATVGAEWQVKDGLLVIKEGPLDSQTYKISFTLSPDGDTLKMKYNPPGLTLLPTTYTRKK